LEFGVRGFYLQRARFANKRESAYTVPDCQILSGGRLEKADLIAIAESIK